MSEVWRYTKSKALLTAIVLTLGGLFIVAVNFRDNIHANWEFIFTILIPCLWGFSFLPLGICSIVNKFTKPQTTKIL